jgi:hypothetical protein
MRMKLVTEEAEFHERGGRNPRAPLTTIPGPLPRVSVPFRAFCDQLLEACEVLG